MRIIYWQCQTPIVAKKILAFSQCQIFQSTQRSRDSRKEEKVNLPDGFLQRVPSLGSRPASQFILPPPPTHPLTTPVPTIVTSRISFRRTPSKAAAFVSDIYEAF